jgi:hypothetical protein
MRAQAETGSVQVRRQPSGIIATQVMQSEILDIGTLRSGFDDVPDGFRCEPCTLDLS